MKFYIFCKIFTPNNFFMKTTILCCNCGIGILPNSKNMCIRCMSNSAVLEKKIVKSMTLESCRGCERYYFPPKSWKHLPWGSQELLIYCLERNKSVKNLNIVNTNFVFTEEHSKRITIEITFLEDEVEHTVNLKFHLHNKQCGDCMRTESKQFWNSIVQLRQHPMNKRTFFHLSNLIKQHKAHSDTPNIMERSDGIDFYFTKKHMLINW